MKKILISISTSVAILLSVAVFSISAQAQTLDQKVIPLNAPQINNVVVSSGGSNTNVLQDGNAYTISWTESNTKNPIQVSLYQLQGTAYSNILTIATVNPVGNGQNSISWNIPTTFATSTSEYEIYVQTTNAGGVDPVQFGPVQQSHLSFTGSVPSDVQNAINQYVITNSGIPSDYFNSHYQISNAVKQGYDCINNRYEPEVSGSDNSGFNSACQNSYAVAVTWNFTIGGYTAEVGGQASPSISEGAPQPFVFIIENGQVKEFAGATGPIPRTVQNISMTKFPEIDTVIPQSQLNGIVSKCGTFTQPDAIKLTTSSNTGNTLSMVYYNWGTQSNGSQGNSAQKNVGLFVNLVTGENKCDDLNLVGAPVMASPAPSISAASTVIFSRALSQGSTGNDVKALQQYLNAHGFFIASNGPGSSGQETNFFGNMTRVALAKFQAANGITPSVGYFGLITKAYVLSHQ